MIFQVPALIQGISTLKDKTLKMTVYTSRELKPDEMTLIFGLEQKEGWFVFSENTIQASDVPQTEAKVEKEEKTPSQRLRAVTYLFVKQQQSCNIPEYAIRTEANKLYNQDIERLIEYYKKKLH